jgi:hypothetical protein
MTKERFKGQNNIYIPGEMLMESEGWQLFSVSREPDLVIKIFHEPLSTSQIEKLQFMLSYPHDKIANHCSWPKDLVSDNEGNVRGFVMRKLHDYFPIYVLLDPAYRMKVFPEKGYNFLVHVSGNLARAFHGFHESGIVVGNINDTDIVVNEKGMVVFINCDSFQIKNGNKYYLCNAGANEFTAPELLRSHHLGKEIRTVDTDTFGMSVLIFQLLFLGRHPFIGKNDKEERNEKIRAIKHDRFAYSKHNHHLGLHPPENTFSIENLSMELSELFHIGLDPHNIRPYPTKWIQELEAYETQMISCAKCETHFYPGPLKACPWCGFEQKQGLLFFQPDNYLWQTPMGNHIDNFVHHFKAQLPDIKDDFNFGQVGQVEADYIPWRYFVFPKLLRLIGFFLFIVFAIAAFSTGGLSILFGLMFFAVLSTPASLKIGVGKELTRRREFYLMLGAKLDIINKEYQCKNDEYGRMKNKVATLAESIENYNGLPMTRVAQQGLDEILASKKQNLAAEIRGLYRHLQYIVSTIEIRQAVILKEFEVWKKEYFQAKADYYAFSEESERLDRMNDPEKPKLW